MQYQEAVTEFRSLDETIEAGQWRQAQIVWEQVNAGKTRRAFAQAVSKGEQYIGKLYRVWQYKINSPASELIFATIYEMVSTQAETPEEALATRHANRAGSELNLLPPRERAQIIREHLADPDVAKHTFNAPEPDDETAAKARMHAGSAISRHDQRIQEHLGEKRHGEAVRENRTDQEALYEVAAMMQVLADVVVTGGKLARKSAEGATFNAGTRNALADRAMKAKATVEWLEAIRDEQHAEDVDEVLRAWAAEA